MNPILTVHRSTREIGGNCIEITYGGGRLLLDAGNPLESEWVPEKGRVPNTLDITSPVDGVIISHAHQDHFGLLDMLPEEWPVWSGWGAETLMRLTAAIKGVRLKQQFHNYKSFEPFQIGPFSVTPYLTDHSAFDAHMLLIEVGGKRILYSGDFRRTGRKAKLVDRLIKNPPRNVDVLILEGTTLGRSKHFPTEADIEEEFVSLFKESNGRVFITWSAQNIDRTVTIYRACKRTQRTLILDLYSVDVLARLEKYYPHLPQLGWPFLRAVVTRGIKHLYDDPQRINNAEFFKKCCESGFAFSAAKIENKKNDVIMLRPTLLRDFISKDVVLTSDDTWVFSMWDGYLKNQDYQATQKCFNDAKASIRHIHTSGHASPEELKCFAESIAARYLVPIHSFEWDNHLEQFENVKRLSDGQPFEII